MVNLRQLTYFCEVIDLGSITAAAEVFRLAQPALGYQLRRLEKELEVSLIVRHSRGVAPTDAGRLLHRHAKRILGDLDQAIKEIKAYNNLSTEKFRLGVSSSSVLVLGPERLVSSMPKSSNLTVSLVEERSSILIEALQKGEIDVALINNIPYTENLSYEAVLEEDLLLVTSPETAAAGKEVGLAEALEHRLVMGGDRSVLRSIVESESKKLSLKTNVAYEVHSLISMKDMVKRGAVASIMPYGVVRQEILSGALFGRRIVNPCLMRTLYIVRQSENIAVFHNDFVNAHIAKLIEAYIEIVGGAARRLGLFL